MLKRIITNLQRYQKLIISTGISEINVESRPISVIYNGIQIRRSHRKNW